MKKLLTACLAGAVACTIAFGAAACGPQADLDGKTFGDAVLTVKASPVSEAVDISDLLFGLFLEDINFASYGLDDNMVANGNFEALTDGSAPAFGNSWSSVSGATFTVGETDGIFANHADYHNTVNKTNVNPHYAQVVVTAAGGGISNAGYRQVPMAFSRGEKYKFSAFVKAEKATKMTVKATNGAMTFINEEISVPQGSEWIKYERTVSASNTGAENTKLEITFDTAGTYYVDAVQLETMDSTLGFKNYIYNAIKDLSPKFMRFPGGCIIEGDNSNKDENGECVEVYDWKNSIGAVQNGPNAGDDTVPAFTYKLDTDGTARETTTYGEWVTRTNNYDLWGYNMDYGLGFYEYFLLCESIGASPVPIVNCGLSDQGGAAAASHRGTDMYGRHGKKVPDYIQDALNLIEFANGDTTTKWGKIRSDLGHPEPFNLKYIGIGNEQFGSTYFSYYQQFLEAFRPLQISNAAVYGGVEPIVGNGMVFSDCEYGPSPANNVANTAAQAYKSTGKISKISEYGVVDHHYYMGYLDFFHFATDLNCIYDKYSRERETGYKVFVGEYSANCATAYYGTSSASKTNTWVSALSEAAYMTALERNGDVIDLAAYAPMFGVSNGKMRDDTVNQWAVDMMYFTNTDILLSPNYYVQQLFMKNSGTRYLKSQMTDIADDYAYDMPLDGVRVDLLYQAVTYDEATGDIIVKIVNAGEDPLKVNFDLSGASVKSVADATILEGAYGLESINQFGEDGYEVLPRSFTIGVSSTFGYEVPATSVTAIRIHTK